MLLGRQRSARNRSRSGRQRRVGAGRL